MPQVHGLRPADAQNEHQQRLVNSTLRPLITLQKRAIRTITFSKPDEHSEPLFKGALSRRFCCVLVKATQIFDK